MSGEPQPKGKPRGNARRRPLRSKSEKRRSQADAEEQIRQDVIYRDGGCVLRNRPDHICQGRMTVHHLQKASACGSFTPDNLVCLCWGANTVQVENDPLWARHVGLVVRWGITPAEAWDARVACGLIVRTDRPEEPAA